MTSWVLKSQRIWIHTKHYLRHQIVAHFIKFHVLLKDWLNDNVKSLDGSGEKGGDGGPFSIRGYLKYIVKGKVWGGQYIYWFSS